MPTDFRPLTGSRLYAQSLGSESTPYIVASMFTEDMKGHADRLKSSLEKFGLGFVLYEVPTVHRSISLRGSDDIAFCKPNFIQQMQSNHHARVLFVDADMVFREPPLKILQATHERIDFATYNWLADVANDVYIPVEVGFADVPSKNKLYQFSHAIDLFDPTQLISSGAVLYYTPDAWPLLQGWLSATDKFPSVVDDQLLDYTYNFVIEKNLIRALWLDKDYCRYPWWIYVRPVIDHPQFPAADNPMRHFKSVAGYERLRPDSIKRRQSQAPFPRDCLIDTTAKCLRRCYSRDVSIVVGRFASDLWIEPAL
jgi:hypothetical protein